MVTHSAGTIRYVSVVETRSVLLRWDNQRLREEMERENLLKRYRQVHEKKNVKKEESDTKMISFFPPISQGTCTE